jgi:hypothetical protein
MKEVFELLDIMFSMIVAQQISLAETSADVRALKKFLRAIHPGAAQGLDEQAAAERAGKTEEDVRSLQALAKQLKIKIRQASDRAS